MKRSPEQLEQYEIQLAELVAVLVKPMTAREIRDALGFGCPSTATVYNRLGVLAERGVIKSQKRRRKIAGEFGQRERIYSVKETQ